MEDCNVERIPCESCGSLILSEDVVDRDGEDLCEDCAVSYESEDY